VKIALLGAESTGKTQLARQLAQHLRAQGSTVALIPEILREWCDSNARTPRPDEQEGIAREQARRAGEATGSGWVIADTTPLMIAIYSDMLFRDTALYDMALAHQSGYDLTLVTGLDLPWVADGHQRDGPHVREPVDAMVRSALQRGGLPYRVVYGKDGDRLANALAAIGSVAPHARLVGPAGQLICEHCGDSQCERRLFSRLLG
jgi:nicotinamide riboside kinase